jgi:hypothetical protein
MVKDWLYRQELIKDNPITRVDSPKMTRVILSGQTPNDYAVYMAIDYLSGNGVSLLTD